MALLSMVDFSDPPPCDRRALHQRHRGRGRAQRARRRRPHPAGPERHRQPCYSSAQYPAGEGLKLCFLGHIQQEKGINAFIRAWLKIRQPADQLVIAGRSVDGAYFEAFQALVEQAQGAISYRGYLERGEVMDLLDASHFLVLPSGLEEAGGMRENFGNVVAEAMAAGRPVLVAKGLAWDHLESVRGRLCFRTNPEAAAGGGHSDRAQSLGPSWSGSECRAMPALTSSNSSIPDTSRRTGLDEALTGAWSGR